MYRGEDVLKVRELYEKGLSKTEIARILGIFAVLPHFRCNLDTGRRIFLESREPLYDTQDWGFVACGGSSGDLAWSLSKRDRIPPRSFWSWKARP